MTIYTLPICLFLALFWGSFVFWRLLHQSARYNEFEIFDALIWSTFAGVIIGRAVHVGWHFEQFDHWRSWFDMIHYPGFSMFFCVIAASFFFWRYLIHLKITDLELLDYWVRGLSCTLIIYYLGLFIDGSGSGYLVPSWLGFPLGETGLHLFPAPLIGAGFYFIVSFILEYLEKNYRTYTWYRANRSQAKSGFVFFTFLLIYGVYTLISLTFQPPVYRRFGYSWDWLWAIMLIVTDVILLWLHALAPRHQRKPNKKVNKK